jgi:MYXO-CTERM domain-containing protein
VNVFRPGETIEVVWNEFINHESYFRIAFEIDGDDFVQRPPQNLSAASDDPVAEENAIDIGQLLAIVADAGSGEHSATVTLPDQECENCTLQLIQFMYGRADSYYYQCADIAIRADGAGGDGGTGNTGGTGGAGAVGVGGTGGAGAVGVGGTGGAADSGGTGGAGAVGVGGTGGTLATGGTGGILATGGTGGLSVEGAPGGTLATGGTSDLGGAEVTGGDGMGGSPVITGSAPTASGGAPFDTGAGPAEPDTAASSGSSDDGSCSSAGPAPSQPGSVGFGLLLALGLIRRRSSRGVAKSLARRRG